MPWGSSEEAPDVCARAALPHLNFVAMFARAHSIRRSDGVVTGRPTHYFSSATISRWAGAALTSARPSSIVMSSSLRTPKRPGK
jgi:hypothetical protein